MEGWEDGGKDQRASHSRRGVVDQSLLTEFRELIQESDFQGLNSVPILSLVMKLGHLHLLCLSFLVCKLCGYGGLYLEGSLKGLYVNK